MHKDKKHSHSLWYIAIGFSALVILCATACICTFLLFLSINGERVDAQPKAVSAPASSAVYDDSAHLEMIKPPLVQGMSSELIYSKVAPCIVDITTYLGDEMATGEGSGIIISEDGLIVTNAHVVADSALCTVSLADGGRYMAKIIGVDSREDLAVLQIDKKGLLAAELGDSAALRIGERVLAIGNASGSLSRSFTEGIVSGLDRSVTTLDDSSGLGLTMKGLIQTDAAINPGNSGGALINAHGQVVGINTLRLADDNMSGIGFAISMDKALPMIDTLIDLGYIPHASLGVTVKSYVLGRDMPFANVPIEGVYFMSISEGSPFTGTDVKEGDIIISADGASIQSTQQLVDIINSHKPKDKLVMQICSAASGMIQEYTIELMEVR